MSRRSPAQARMLEEVRAGVVELVASPRGGYYWRVRGIRVSASTDAMIDRLVEAGEVSSASTDDSRVSLAILT